MQAAETYTSSYQVQILQIEINQLNKKLALRDRQIKEARAEMDKLRNWFYILLTAFITENVAIFWAIWWWLQG